MPKLDRRVAPVVEAVRDLIALQRRSLADVEREMGYSQKYLYKLLSGAVEIKLVHLMDVLDALRVEHRDFWCRLCGQASDPDTERRLAALEAAIRRSRPPS